jgi:hypothetical protein
MIENGVSLKLDRPPEQVFDFLVDFTNEPAWNPECLEVEKTSAGRSARVRRTAAGCVGSGT